MSAAEARPAEAPPAEVMARRLPVLLDRLRAAGYGVGPDEIVNVRRLLARLACAGGWPPEPARLARTLAPVLCKSAREQRDFGGHFEAWLAASGVPLGSRAEKAVPSPEPKAAPGPAVDGAARRSRAWRWWAAAAVLAAAVLAAMLTRQSSEQVPAAEVTVGERGGAGTERPVLELFPDVRFWPLAFAVSLWLVPFYLAWLYGGWLPAWLSRRATFELPELDRLSFAHSMRPLGESWRGIQSLSDRDLRPDPGLDAEATVLATIEKGGYFTPVHGRRPELPEYLACIDRRSPDDHLARFAEELMRRLSERGLATRTLFFARDPCRGVGGPGRGYVSLGTLSSRARDERLLVISEAEPWLGPSGGRQPVGQLLGSWRQRALLTPAPSSEWGRPERVLAAGSLPVFPLSDAGLTSLAERFAAHAPQPAEPDSSPESRAAGGRYPALLLEDSERRLDARPPSRKTVRGLAAALTDYLAPEGARWLRACAVFPALSWPVTCYLGHELSDGEGRPLFDERRLLCLARLPWFRYGTMPDWLRFELIEGMDRDERRRVWRTLRKLLAEATRATEPGSEPEVAQEPVWWRKDRWLSRFLARQADDSPLREYLFLSFMRGRKALRLTLAAPRRLRELIRDADRWSVVSSALLALVATAVTALWYRLAALVDVGGPTAVEIVKGVLRTGPPEFPEAVILVSDLLLSVLVVAAYGAWRKGAPAAAIEAPGVPGLMERITERRLSVLVPPVAVAGIAGFLFADLSGSAAGEARLVAGLAAAIVYGLSSLYLELGVTSGFRARLDELEDRLRPDAGAEVIRELLAFLRGRASGKLKRRALRLLHGRIRQPEPELLDELFELRHGGALGPRNKHLLASVVKSLDQRYRERRGPREEP